MAATLTATEIIADTIEAFKKQLPMLSAMGIEYSATPKAKGQQVLAHIELLGTASTYDPTTGYANGATDAKNLLADVPITLNQHSHVPAKVDYLDAIATAVNKYQRAVANLGYVLGKTVVDYALSKIVAANFSQSSTEAEGDTDRDTLSVITSRLNAKGAALSGRFGLVNSNVANSLDGDVRIASKLFYGQEREENPYIHIRNIVGFANIWEYPDLPTTANLTGFFGDRRAIIGATAPPDHSSDVAKTLGIPQQGVMTLVSDPDTKLTFLGIGWQTPGTFNNLLTMALLYDFVAGSQGGSAGDKTDYAGHILKKA